MANSSSNPSLWAKTKTSSKAGFDKLWAYADKLGAPVNRLSNKLGAEAFWPTTLDKESDKAARILRSFCKDGFYQEEEVVPEDGPKQKQRVIMKIPTKVIREAKGLAIFTTMRTGLWVSGAGGSGIVFAKREDGSWSPPTGILLHTAGLGFLVGVDIYDCVLVLNTQDALDAFTKVRCTVGGEISAVAGPVGTGGVLESEVHKRRAPIFTYLKSRGFYAGVQIDGTVIIERTDENERFYGSKYSAAEILQGKARPPSALTHRLFATLRAAQGDMDVDESAIPNEPPPADFEVEQDGHVFGIPDKEDPDPYGVEALSKEGLEVKEAATHSPVPNSEFEFSPRERSIAYAIRHRQDSESRSPRREAFGRENHRRYASSDHSTQTDFDAGVVAKSPTSIDAPGPIELNDNEADTKISTQPDEVAKDSSAPRSSYEDISLHGTPQKPVARGPPPVLPPRGPVAAPKAAESAPSATESVPTAAEPTQTATEPASTTTEPTQMAAEHTPTATEPVAVGGDTK